MECGTEPYRVLVVVRRREHRLQPIRMDAGLLEQVLELHAAPRSVAPQVAADLVANAHQRVLALAGGQRGQLVVGQLHGSIDQPVDLQSPATDCDRGINEVL